MVNIIKTIISQNLYFKYFLLSIALIATINEIVYNKM